MNSQLKICFAIPASPTKAFYSQIAIFRLALDSFGGIYKNATIILSLGHESILPVSEKWLSHLGKNTILSWATLESVQKIGARAQGDNRWKYNYDDYDVIIFSDADTILIQPIDKLLLQIKNDNLISGVIAHYPFPYHINENPNELWDLYSKEFLGKEIPLDFWHTLSHPIIKNTRCPFYLNYGFVAMTPQVLRIIKDSYLDIRPKIMPLLLNPAFCGQIALTLAIYKHEILKMSLPMRYNFPNDPIADNLYPEELSSISVLHYLRTDKFDRQKIFVSEKDFKDFLSLKLKGSNKVFQEFVRSLTKGTYPFI